MFAASFGAPELSVESGPIGGIYSRSAGDPLARGRPRAIARTTRRARASEMPRSSETRVESARSSSITHARGAVRHHHAGGSPVVALKTTLRRKVTDELVWTFPAEDVERIGR